MARTEEHFIWTGDFATRLDAAYAAAQAAKDDTTPLLGGEEHPYDVLRREYEELKADAVEAGHRVVLRGLRDNEWDEIVDQHPPRTEEPFADSDKALGFNERTGSRPFLRAALAEPKFDTRAQLDDWIADLDLSRGDVAQMVLKAWQLTNGRGLSDPKSLPHLPTRTADKS